MHCFSIRLFLPLIFVAALTLWATVCKAQPVDMVLSGLTQIASFEEAAAMDVDPTGIIYVLDQGSQSLFRLSSDGKKLEQFGGPGEGEGQFDFPADIDATNGLVLVVADAGNGRIQRFSREFLFLETLAVGVEDRGRSTAFGGEPGYRQRDGGRGGVNAGRPIAVITSPNNDMYAIDEVENVVLKWDKNRNLEHVIGAYDQGAGSLVQPVAMALGEDGTLFVGDRAQESISVFDPYGGFIRTMAEGLCANVQSLYIQNDKLLVALPDKILLYHTSGMLERTIGVKVDGEIVDVAIADDVILVLSERALWQGAWR